MTGDGGGQRQGAGPQGLPAQGPGFLQLPLQSARGGAASLETPQSIKRRSLLHWASPVAQTVKNLPAMRETQVRSLGQEDPPENGMETHSSILAWRIPGIDRRATVHRVATSWTQLSGFHFSPLY